ncbi:MYPU_1760 family metalloprotease [Mycoplasmopsis cynos]|uniref:MYPU_1760 family metalloprotease n=1 Tax=Mycoplasmopsis cynos TaxID=171284 RepID=UPI002AFDCE69|nr:hypothetical protein [Mycoplasmopsis cynos]WQQ17579.1 hypothetical protein RRG56_03460 [Mycoplasmopsis cynos]
MKKKKFLRLPISIGLFSGLSILTSCSLIDSVLNTGNTKENPPDVQVTPPIIIKPKPPHSKPNIEKFNPKEPNEESKNNETLIPIQESEVYLTPGLSNENKEKVLNRYNGVSISDYSEIKEYKRKDDYYLEYIDPYTNIKFRDFSYHQDKDGSRRYLLDREGLLNLAQEFKRKIPFGTEVFDLDSININDFTVINQNANGLYLPEFKKIFINGSIFAEKDFSSYEIIGGLMPTIFHEYMHHWATTYAETGILDDEKVDINNGDDINKRQTTLIYYNPSTTPENTNHTHGSQQFWNAYFASKFYKLLNYDFNKKSYIEPSTLYKLRINSLSPEENYPRNLLHMKLSLNDIWRLSNEFQTPNYLFNNPPANLEMPYSPSGAFTLSTPRLKYNFSLTELIPREYTKYGYESYFSINDENKSLDNEIEEKATINWFGTRFITLDKKGRKIKVFSPSGNAEDWSKTYLNNFDSPTRQYWFQDGVGINPNDGTRKDNAIAFPNSVFDISGFRYIENKNNKKVKAKLPSVKSKNRSLEFYKLFLETMGYGKTISQIYYENKVTPVDKNNVKYDRSAANNIKFSGYLKANEKVSGIVLKGKNGIYGSSKFKYLSTFSFFGHKNYDEGAKLYEIDENKYYLTTDRQKQIENRYYPADAGYSENYVSYITNDYITVNDDDTEIYLWNDINNDNIATDDELLLDKKITLPTQRAVSSQRSTNVSLYDFNKFIVENNDNKTIIRILNKRTES